MLLGCGVVEGLPLSLPKMSESEALLPVPTPPMMNDAAKMAARTKKTPPTQPRRLRIQMIMGGR
jgi:hypothetical protein